MRGGFRYVEWSCPCHIIIAEHTVIAGKWNKSNVLALSLIDQQCDRGENKPSPV